VEYLAMAMEIIYVFTLDFVSRFALQYLNFWFRSISQKAKIVFSAA
jgi:hypothetical protein